MNTLSRKSDLSIRTSSAVVMVAVAGTAMWLGGYAWAAFVALVAAGVFWEWVKLSQAITSSPEGRAAWFAAGVLYVGIAGLVLVVLRYVSPKLLLLMVFSVIATDVGAYFVGRALGGPKIAAHVSPSETWSGLYGGMLVSGLVWAGLVWFWQTSAINQSQFHSSPTAWKILLMMLTGAVIAVIAQAGDFFESWMKRNARVKDSGHLIPGHGGLFDRVDGLLAVLFLFGIFLLPLLYIFRHGSS